MTKAVKDFLLDHVTGAVDIEYSDNSTLSYNLANVVTATQSAQGVAITGITASTAAPNNADGKPDGTIYIQVA